MIPLNPPSSYDLLSHFPPSIKSTLSPKILTSSRDKQQSTSPQSSPTHKFRSSKNETNGRTIISLRKQIENKGVILPRKSTSHISDATIQSAQLPKVSIDIREDPWAPRKTVDIVGVSPTDKRISPSSEKKAIERSRNIDWTQAKRSTESRHTKSKINLVSQALSKLCGIFSPSKLFHEALKYLSSIIELSEDYPWYNYHQSLDEALSASLETLLTKFDSNSVITTNHHYYWSKKIQKFTPPDILWVLIQTCDKQILDSLIRVIKKKLLENFDIQKTQRGIIYILLLNKSLEFRFKGFKGQKSFSESIGLLFIQNGCFIDEDFPIDKVAWEDIQNVILKFD